MDVVDILCWWVSEGENYVFVIIEVDFYCFYIVIVII